MHNTFIPEELIEEIRLKNDIVDVVSEYVRLEKKGKYFFGLCPFHSEKTPSFTVTPNLQIFNCFGCHKGGNVFHFIMNMENLDFLESVKYLADRAGIKLPESGDEKDTEAAKLRYEIIEINKSAAYYFCMNINSSKGRFAKEYLKERGINNETAKAFVLGYSLPEADDLYKYLIKSGFSKKGISESGLVIKTKKDEYIDIFRNRLMFPIFDIRGNTIGFGGRVLDNSTPKYINSPETPIYNKGSNLYALNIAKYSGKRELIVVEGYMDAISLHQCGLINTVASLGTALTVNQGKMLKKYAEEIILAFDADAPGQKAALRSLDLLGDFGCNLKILIIPNGKDPDEFIREFGAHEFTKLVKDAIPLVEYKIECLKKEYNVNDIEGKIKFINKASEILSGLKSKVETEIYVKKIAREFDVSEESIYSEISRKLNSQKTLGNEYVNKIKKISSYNKTAIKKKPSYSSEFIKQKNDAAYIELLLIALLCTNNSLFESIKGKIDIEGFSANNKVIVKTVFEKLDRGKNISVSEILNIMDIETADNFTNIIKNDCVFENNEKAAVDLIDKLNEIKLKERKNEILEILKKNSSINKEEEKRLLDEMNLLVKELRNIKKSNKGGINT